MSANEDAGVIRPEELYCLNTFRRRIGVTDATLRTARRCGLKVYYLHNRAFIYGRDWISYVLSRDQGNGLALPVQNADEIQNLVSYAEEAN